MIVRDTHKALLIIIVQYLLFFYPVLSPNNILTGSFTTDSLSLHYPSYAFLHEKLQEHQQFFWTERIYGGFPVYTDLERGFLNPLNIFSLAIFDQFTSYKIMHFTHYFVGALFLYMFFKEKKLSITAFASANVIFFFSFYLMVRQELFNTVLIVYLLPIGLYLTEKIITTQKLKYGLYKGLWIFSMVSWGQFNFITILLMIDFLYLSIYAYRRIYIRPLTKILGTMLLSATILCIPLIYPFLNMFLAGDRGSGNLKFIEGSHEPITALTSVFPFLWGTPENYVGKIIKNELYLNEVYTYVGISTIILAATGLALLRSKRDRLFFGFLLFGYVCLAFIEYVPLLNKAEIPPISFFRYWGRAALFLTFSCAYLAAFALDNLKKHSINLKNLLILTPPLVLYVFLLTKTYKNAVAARTFSHILNGGIPKDGVLYCYIVVLVSSVSLIAYTLLKAKKDKYLSVVLALLISIDLFVPAQKLLSVYYQNKKDFEQNLHLNLEPYRSNRILYIDNKKIFGNTMMYQPSWGLFGYSGPIESGDYVAYINSLGFESVRRAKIDTPPEKRKPEFITGLQKAGVTTVFELDGQIESIPPISKLDILTKVTSKTEAKYVTKEEGLITMVLNSNAPQEIETNIRNYKGWKLSINGNKHDFSNTNSDLFLKFNLPEGENLVELRYIPEDFIKGLLVSVGLSVLSLFFYLTYTKMNKRA